MFVKVSLTGTSPLLMHNPQMVDPNFEINRQIKAITSKRNKTDEDLREIERLEWYGGLYTSPNGNGKPIVVQPTSKPRKCFIETGRIFKLGKQVERAFSFTELNSPLVYDGPKELEAMRLLPQFTSRLSVGVSGKRIMRVRPQFFPWSLVMRGMFVEDAGMNFEDLERIVQLAGVVQGIGDNRTNGYGRFVGQVAPE